MTFSWFKSMRMLLRYWRSPGADLKDLRWLGFWHICCCLGNFPGYRCGSLWQSWTDVEPWIQAQSWVRKACRSHCFGKLKAPGGSSTPWTLNSCDEVNPRSLFGNDAQFKRVWICFTVGWRARNKRIWREKRSERDMETCRLCFWCAYVPLVITL